MESVTTDKPDMSCTFDDEHPGSSSTADEFKDSVSALSTATLAIETTQHTLRKNTNVLSEKGRNTLLVLMIESCIIDLIRNLGMPRVWN